MTDTQLPLGDDANAKEVLLRSDDAFRRLVSEHQALDEQLRRLSTLTFPTDQQQLEEVSLKKKKLALKDRIQAILRTRDPRLGPAVADPQPS